MKKSLLTIIIPVFLFSKAWAHEGDHDAPGAIPFAPHGGKAAEASELTDDDHEHEDEDHEDEGEAEEHIHESEGEPESKHSHEQDEKPDPKTEPSIEYFFEAAYSKGRLTIYPLTLDERNPKEFLPSSVSGDLSNLRVSVEFPRSKRSEDIAMELVRDEKSGDHWRGQVPGNKDIRFFANIQANWKGVERKSRIHLEKSK